MTPFDEVVIMLHKFDSNSELTFFYPASHFRLFTQNCVLRQAPHYERTPQFCALRESADMLLFMTSVLGKMALSQSACRGFVRPKKRLIIVSLLGLITAVVVKTQNAERFPCYNFTSNQINLGAAFRLSEYYMQLNHNY